MKNALTRLPTEPSPLILGEAGWSGTYSGLSDSDPPWVARPPAWRIIAPASENHASQETTTQLRPTAEQRPDPADLPRLLPGSRPYDRPLDVARPRRRRDVAVHQFGHGAVQGHLPGNRAAAIHPSRRFAEMLAGGGETQRPGRRGPRRQPPHLL